MGSQFNSSLWGNGIYGGTTSPGVTGVLPTLVSDVLYAAMRIAGVLHGPGHSGSAIWVADGLRSINAMLGAWNASGLNLPGIAIDTYTLTPGWQDYGIGPGGDFDVARPQKIVGANVMFMTAPIVRRKLYLASTEDWQEITVQQVLTIPNMVYYDSGSPVGGLHFHPIPDQAYPIELFTWQLIGGFTSAAQKMFLPPEYEEAITYNLAVRLASLWRTQMTPEAMAVAAKTLNDLQSKNAQSPRLRNDVGGGRRGGGKYNYLSGGVE